MRFTSTKIYLGLLSLLLLTCTSAMGNVLEGVVTDLSGSRVITARIVVSGDAFSRTVQTNGEGVYKTVLPAGSFRFRAFAFGFCPVNRAPIDVSGDDTSNTINFTMIECSIGRRIPINGVGDDLGDEYRLPFDEQRFSLSYKNKNVDSLAQFGKKTLRHDNVTYEAFRLDNQTLAPASISWGFISVRAYRIRVNSKTREIEAQGSVVYENNGERIESEHLRIELDSGVSEIQMPRE